MVELNKAARNERRKLSATFLNGIAMAVFAIGGFTPVFQVIGGVTTPSIWIFVMIPVCMIGAFALHLFARYQLRGIEE
ncbi:MAG: amino acid transporter [Alphaproteobacteria bacterium]|nr:MAG: amino acid transporter [Alphaproteobacteria bacterium]